MGTVMEPLRIEHRALLPHIEDLRKTADGVGTLPVPELRNRVDEVYSFLADHLIPHAEAEDAALYPVVARVMGAAESTATMSRDHAEVGRLTRELNVLRLGLSGRARSEAHERGLRRVLYGLYALVRVHFAKEEELYLPLLEAHLTASQAEDMFRAMEEAAHAARAAPRTRVSI